MAVCVANTSSWPITSEVPGSGKLPPAGVGVASSLGAREAGLVQAARPMMSRAASRMIGMRFFSIFLLSPSFTSNPRLAGLGRFGEINFGLFYMHNSRQFARIVAQSF
jgi:hypothetical protein